MRVKITVEYSGTNYVGWQRQKNGRSIQGEIEESLKNLFNQSINIHVAGRTDAGVHAFNQVAHFDVQSKIKPEKISSGINHFLKNRENQISILNSEVVGENFHSRFSAKKRSYVYKILNRRSPSPLIHDRVWYIPYKLDLNVMKEASRYLIGKHDFNSFRSTQCQSNSSIKSIDSIKFEKKDENINIYIEAKSFLHNQVRIIVGSLINVGRNFWKTDKIKEILGKKMRSAAGPTAPPEGLYLLKIEY